MNEIALMEAASSVYKRKYQCPYCNEKHDRIKLVDHIEKKHSEFIPKDFTASRIVFNIVNKKEKGKCTICGKESPWDEDKCRYDRFCSEKCKKAYEQLAAERLKRVRGMTKQEMLKDPEYQNNVMLANRSISGKYKFQDGTIKTYVASYEHKFLEFMDKFLNVKSEDLETPGPIIEYKFKGETHKWITDEYYVPYNLVFDIKDGGDNPNKREMPEYRAKQIAKEDAIRKQGKYNYIRLTDNKFEQLIELMLELKELYIENNGEYNPIVRINESTNLLESDSEIEVYRCTYKGEGIYEALRKNVDLEIWKSILSSDKINWLPNPPQYKSDKNCRSYFTYKGYKKFSKDVLPIMYKYLDKKYIKIDKLYIYDKSLYQDEYQIVVSKGLDESTVLESKKAKDLGPKVCSKCGSKNIGVFFQGEPIYKCKDCGKYLGTVPFNESTSNDIIQNAFNSVIHTIKWCRMDDSAFCSINEYSEPKIINDSLFSAGKFTYESGIDTVVKTINDNNIFENGKYSASCNNNELIITIDKLNNMNESYIIDKIYKGDNNMIHENCLINKKDIYYNKSKFDSGEVNLCFITGHCGSGKSTMGHSMETEENIECYELDDIIFNWNFSDSDLKEYGNLIYSFFNGPGKKFRYHSYKEWLEDDTWSETNMTDDNCYESCIIKSFVDHSIKYVKSNENTKFVLEGVWVFIYFDPSYLDKYAVYIKGSSMIMSKLRAAKRDSKCEKSRLEILKSFCKKFFVEDWEICLMEEKQIRKFYNYFSSKLTNESYTVNNIHENSMKSNLDKDFKAKGKLSLSEFKRVAFDKSIIDKYKSTTKNLKHADPKDKGYAWIDKYANLVAYCTVDDSKDKNIWITAVEVTKDYQGYGLSKQLLDVATKELKANALSVSINNKLAKNIYEKYGFKVSKDSEAWVKRGKGSMYFMYIGNVNESKSIKESLEVKLTTSPFEKEMVLYHGSPVQDKLSIINPNSYNAGTRLSKPRMSSFWTRKFEYAKLFGLFRVICSELKYKCFFAGDAYHIYVRPSDYNDILRDIKSKHVWVYKKTLDKKYITGGNTYYIDEFTIDVPIKPDESIKIEYNDFIDLLKDALIMLPDDSKETRKRISDRELKVLSKAKLPKDIINMLIYHSVDDVLTKVKDYKSLKEFSIITPSSDKPSQEGFMGHGSWNAIKRVDGEPYRERVEVIIFNKDLDKVLIGTKRYNGRVKLPGGGTDKNSSLESQATKECQEEVKVNIDNLKYIGSYSMPNKQTGYKDDVYKGQYTYLYLATYDSDYTGYIRPEDLDSLYNTAKWMNIYDTKELLKKRSVDLYNLFNYNYKLYINDLSYLKL